MDENLEGRKPQGNLNVSEMMILEIIEENMMLGFGFDFTGEGWGPATLIMYNICQMLHNVSGPWREFKFW